MYLRLVLAALAMSVPVTAPASDTVLEPTGQWVVNFDSAQCFAARNYGSIDKPLYLIIKMPPVGEVVQVAVQRRRPALRAEQLRGTIQFGTGQPIRMDLLEYKPGNDGLRTLIANVSEVDFAAARAASDVRIKTSGLDERFALHSMTDLLGTMDKCLADLRRVWNVRNEEEGRPKLMQAAKGDMRKLFSSDDYPTHALLEGGTGTVKVMILIGKDGKVGDCAVVETSGVPVLDAQACSIITHRAKFSPAVDSDGRPANSAFIQRITWRLQ